jgi:hypothetical protein
MGTTSTSKMMTSLFPLQLPAQVGQAQVESFPRIIDWSLVGSACSRERVARLEQAIDEAVNLASLPSQEVIAICKHSRHRTYFGGHDCSRTGRFPGARELMGYCGAVPGENSSGKRTRGGSIRKRPFKTNRGRGGMEL